MEGHWCRPFLAVGAIGWAVSGGERAVTLPNISLLKINWFSKKKGNVVPERAKGKGWEELLRERAEGQYLDSEWKVIEKTRHNPNKRNRQSRQSKRQ